MGTIVAGVAFGFMVVFAIIDSTREFNKLRQKPYVPVRERTKK